MAFLALTLTVGIGSAGATVQPRSGGSTSSHVSLIQQTAWAVPGGSFSLHLAISSPLPSSDLEIYVGVYHRLTNRSSFAQTLTNHLPTSLMASWDPVRLDHLPTDPSGNATFTIALPAPGATSNATSAASTDVSGRVSLDLTSCTACGGVYPVRVELRSATTGSELDRFTTHLIYTPPDAASHKLNVAWIIPIQARPALGPDGQESLGSTTSNALSALAGSLGRAPGVPVVLAPNPETLQALATSPRAIDQNTLGELRSLAGNTPTDQIISRPYVPINVSVLASVGLASEVSAQIKRGGDVLGSTLHITTDHTTWSTNQTMSNVGLDELAHQGVTSLVLPEADLAGLNQPLTLTQPFGLSHQPSIEAASADPGLASHFASGSEPVLSAHQLLADLAQLYFDSPDSSVARGVVIQTPPTWLPQRGLLDAALAGLSDSPIVAPVTLKTLFSTVPGAPASSTNASGISSSTSMSAARGHTLVRDLAGNQSFPTPPLDLITRTRGRLASLEGALAHVTPSFQTMADVLLVGESADLNNSQQTGYLNGVNNLIDAFVAHVSLPQPHSLTLTSRAGHLPITVVSTLGVTVRGVLHVASDKLAFPRGSTQPVDVTNNSVTAIFDVRARATGAFPLKVSLVSPDGHLILASTRLTVSSTAASVVAVVITVAAVAFLIGWWGRSILRARRGRNPRLIPPSSDRP